MSHIITLISLISFLTLMITNLVTLPQSSKKINSLQKTMVNLSSHWLILFFIAKIIVSS
jgi:hypothetical protein